MEDEIEVVVEVFEGPDHRILNARPVGPVEVSLQSDFARKFKGYLLGGKWDDPSVAGANSDAVPILANGHVYVASYKELNIFGFIPPQNYCKFT